MNSFFRQGKSKYPSSLSLLTLRGIERTKILIEDLQGLHLYVTFWRLRLQKLIILPIETVTFPFKTWVLSQANLKAECKAVGVCIYLLYLFLHLTLFP